MIFFLHFIFIKVFIKFNKLAMAITFQPIMISIIYFIIRLFIIISLYHIILSQLFILIFNFI